MRLDAQRQLTVPEDVCKRLGIDESTELVITEDDRGFYVQPIGESDSRGERFRRQIDKMRGAYQGKFTTDEVMRMTRGDD